MTPHPELLLVHDAEGGGTCHPGINKGLELHGGRDVSRSAEDGERPPIDDDAGVLSDVPVEILVFDLRQPAAADFGWIANISWTQRGT